MVRCCYRTMSCNASQSAPCTTLRRGRSLCLSCGTSPERIAAESVTRTQSAFVPCHISRHSNKRPPNRVVSGSGTWRLRTGALTHRPPAIISTSCRSGAESPSAAATRIPWPAGSPARAASTATPGTEPLAACRRSGLATIQCRVAQRYT